MPYNLTNHSVGKLKDRREIGERISLIPVMYEPS